MNREAEIYVLLEQLDAKTIRALRENDVQRIADLNAQSDALRLELKDIQNAAAN